MSIKLAKQLETKKCHLYPLAVPCHIDCLLDNEDLINISSKATWKNIRSFICSVISVPDTKRTEFLYSSNLANKDRQIKAITVCSTGSFTSFLLVDQKFTKFLPLFCLNNIIRNGMIKCGHIKIRIYFWDLFRNILLLFNIFSVL